MNDMNRTANAPSSDNKTLVISKDTVGYNQRAREEIDAWKHPDQSVWSKAMNALAAPVDQASEALIDSEQFGTTVKEVIEKVLTTLSDTANWTVDAQKVIDDYQSAEQGLTDAGAHSVKDLADISKLPLSVVDDKVKLLKSKYVAMMSAQGITTGVVGWAGIPVDIIGLLTANLRAINEYATYYGFDMSHQNEQMFAISLLSVATSQSIDERQAALNDTISLIRDPEKMAFNKVNEEVMSRVLRQTATKVATNLVKTKAAQVIPAVGAVVAGGVNASYTASVCEAAYQCYRERFLNQQLAI